MKPLKLIIEGFGPYLKRTEIDLTKLGNSGLYLITGSTGSGKTTLFDAISYALYGNPSGKTRDSTMLRCIYAGPEVNTYVEFEFEFRNKKYKVKRNPEYIGMKKNGESTKTVKQDAIFEGDSETITGYEKVTQAVIDLLKIDKEQFAQIVMIAQGNFQKVLIDSTKERIPVYRQLFKTEKYEKLTLLLSEKSKELKNQLSMLTYERTNFFKEISCNKDSVLFLELKDLNSKENFISESFEVIEKIISEDSDNIKKYEKKIKEKNNIKEELLQKITKAETINQAFENLELIKNKIQNEKSKNNDLNQSFIELKGQEQSVKEIEKKAAVIADKLDQYNLLDEKLKNLSELEKEIVTKNEIVLKLSTEIENNEMQISEDEKLLATFSNAGANVIIYENNEKELNSNIDKLKDLNLDFKNKNKFEQDLKLAQKKYLESQKKVEILNAEYLEIKKLFMDNLAGILAVDLEDNKPCPVCGSMDHPKICKIEGQKVTKDLVDEKENILNEAKNENEKDNSEASKLNIQLQNINETIHKKKIENNFSDFSEENFIKKIQEYEFELEKNKKLLNEEKLNIQKKIDLEKRIPELKHSLSETKEELNNLRMEIERDSTNKDSIKLAIEELKKNLEFESKQQAQEKLNSLIEQSESYKNKLEDLTKQVEESNKILNQLNGNKQAFEEQTKNCTKIDLSDLYNDKEKLIAELDELDSAISEVKIRKEKNIHTFEKIKETQEQCQTVEQKFTMVNSLYKTASGNLGNGKIKIMLETFVQMAYLDKVILFANERLKIMTDNQYELIRKKDDFGNVSISGLEIEVIDHFNGGIRSVKSLSGGEQFLASLSLALGLSDVVRHSSSGIKIDTMFIDEGFGTLDTDTLNKSYKALVSLTEGTDRLIGIISHVEGLKEKIKKQVYVTKTGNSGSSVQIYS